MTIYKLNKIFKLVGMCITLISMSILFDLYTSFVLCLIYIALMILDFLYCTALRKTNKVKFVPTNKTICISLLPYILCMMITEIVCYLYL